MFVNNGDFIKFMKIIVFLVVKVVHVDKINLSRRFLA